MTTPGEDFPTVWRRALDAMDASGVSSQQRAFVRLTRPLGLLDGTVLLAAPNDLTKEVLEQRMRETIVDLLSAELGRPVRLAVTVDPSLLGGDDAETPSDGIRVPRHREDPDAHDFRPNVIDIRGLDGPPPHRSQDGQTDDRGGRDEGPGRDGQDQRDFGYDRSGRGSAPVPARSAEPGTLPDLVRPGTGRSAPTRPTEPARLNPKYTFETFVIGASNRFAHAASVAVAEAPAKAYNPLFVYGESGLGKTHLLHAIGHYAQNLYPGLRVRYVNSEEFTNDFINSIRDDKASAFQRRYRDVDVLLIDDIQFLQGKVQTQEEFFHTFNTLHNANKQVVITSDLPPKQLAGFEERMRSTVRVGPDHRRPAARPRDPDRDPAQEGDRRTAAGPRRRPGVHRSARSRRTSASSRAP